MKATKVSKKPDEITHLKMSNQENYHKALPTPILDTFYPNECYICKTTKDLRRCRRCQMISYCGEIHQKDHLENHKEICKIIAGLIKQKGISHLYENLRGIDQKRWKDERETAKMQVQSKLSRPLLRNELQMLLYPRSCFVCHEAKQKNLVNCPSCSSVSFCSQHKSTNSHSINCFHLKFCHDLDIGLSEENLTKAVAAAQLVVDRTFFTSENQTLPKSLKQLITHYPKPPVEAAENVKIYSSEFLTNPLTLFNVLQKLQFSTVSKLVVHVSGFEPVYDNPIFWEILLHLSPHLKFLKILIVNDKQNVKKESNLCNNCKWHNKTLELESVALSYGEYLNDSSFQEPNILVCYNVEPSEANQIYQDDWKSSLSAWGSLSCPLVFTTRTDTISKEMTQILESSFPKSKFYSEALNEFASLRPTRDWELGGIFKDNQFMIILQLLHGEENEKTPDMVNGIIKKEPISFINKLEKKLDSLPNQIEKILYSDRKKIAISLESINAKMEMNNSAPQRNNVKEKTLDLVNGDVLKNSDAVLDKVQGKSNSDKDLVQKSDFVQNEIDKTLESDKDKDKDKIEENDSASPINKTKSTNLDENLNGWDFFYINSCQVCHTKHRVVPCTRCKMISYCGENHRKEHWPKHKDICKVILGMMKENEATNLFDKLKTNNMETWIRVKVDIMLKAQSKLGRQLLDYEKQMFLFPKTCFDCHESDLSILKTCNCGISLCKQHKKNLKHQNFCDDFKEAFENLLLLQMANAESLPTIADQGSTMISIKSVPIQTTVRNLPSTIKDFMDSCITSSGEVAKLFSEGVGIFSKVLSRPLTLLYGIQKLNLTNVSSLTIHVIGATNEEFRCVGYWEILLHWLPRLKEITVVFIGPEINGPFQLTIQACESCNFISKKPALVFSRRSRYNEYFESKFFSKPDIIVGYNLDLHESELGVSEYTWKESIMALKNLEAPFILTAGTKERAKKDHERFCNLLEKSVFYNCCEINPFASLIPERDFETEELKYANKYIVIYKGLYESMEKENKSRVISVQEVPKALKVSPLKVCETLVVAEEIKEDKNKSQVDDFASRNKASFVGLEDCKKQFEVVKMEKEEIKIGASGLIALEEKLSAAKIKRENKSAEIFEIKEEKEDNKMDVLFKAKQDSQVIVKAFQNKAKESTNSNRESKESDKNESKVKSENRESKARSESKTNSIIVENSRLVCEDLLKENLFLRKENKLLNENQQLKEENRDLKDENQKLKQENERLRIENNIIKDLRSQIEESIRSAINGIYSCIK